MLADQAWIDSYIADGPTPLNVLEPGVRCCFNCSHWKFIDNPLSDCDGLGECHHHSPISVYGVTDPNLAAEADCASEAVWPQTTSNERCGDFDGSDPTTSYLRELRADPEVFKQHIVEFAERINKNLPPEKET